MANFLPNQMHVNAFYIRIAKWHERMLEQCREDLPKEEFKLAKASLDKLFKKAKLLHADCDSEIEQVWGETIYFTLPWKVLLWYSMNPKKKTTNNLKG